MNFLKASIQRYQLGSLLLLVLLLAVVLPLSLDIFRLNLVGKYLTYAFVAVGLVMVWGYGGVLSLGQGVFFGLGGYAMAMFLKLEASDPVSTKIQSTPGIPDFMDWNQITALPAFWLPFKSLPLTLILVVAVPMALAWLISFAMFKRRVGGVYFAIITQAVALILTVLIIGQQGYTGGVNGMTDLKTMLGWDTRTDSAKYILYYVCVALLVAAIVLCRWIQTSKLGTLLLAMRDKEDRVRFSGYDVSNFKVFTFCLAAGLSGIGGAMFALQVGFMSPSFVGIVPSIEMVIFCAVGGRMSLVGAVYGALLVNAGKTLFSESFPDLWLFLMAGLFIGVTMAFPMGLAGLWEEKIRPWWKSRRQALREAAVKPPAVASAPVAPTPEPEPHAARRRGQPARLNRRPTMSNTDFALAVEDLSVSFDGFKAIDDLTLYIDRNELRVIIGPNGAGKDDAARPDLRQDAREQRQHQVQEHGADEDGRAQARAAGHRAQVPDTVDLREPQRVPEPRGVVSQGPLGVRRAGLPVRRRGQGTRAGRGDGDRVGRPARHRSGPAEPWPEAVARDRDAADAGTRAADAR